uniref:Uncharacterized protein n=1 Tax=Oryza sativa subsp. japonica TaxID=39947 RepID=Q7EY62_ORYSJ|nr:hypothetical protein [Oryza sativa Japonica Group]BAD31232.1 hypothetical protein [Oryza sativa Japonica Group]
MATAAHGAAASKAAARWHGDSGAAARRRRRVEKGKREGKDGDGAAARGARRRARGARRRDGARRGSGDGTRAATGRGAATGRRGAARDGTGLGGAARHGARDDATAATATRRRGHEARDDGDARRWRRRWRHERRGARRAVMATGDAMATAEQRREDGTARQWWCRARRGAGRGGAGLGDLVEHVAADERPDTRERHTGFGVRAAPIASWGRVEQMPTARELQPRHGERRGGTSERSGDWVARSLEATATVSEGGGEARFKRRVIETGWVGPTDMWDPHKSLFIRPSASDGHGTGASGGRESAVVVAAAGCQDDEPESWPVVAKQIGARGGPSGGRDWGGGYRSRWTSHGLTPPFLLLPLLPISLLTLAAAAAPLVGLESFLAATAACDHSTGNLQHPPHIGPSPTLGLFTARHRAPSSSQPIAALLTARRRLPPAAVPLVLPLGDPALARPPSRRR